jgi:2-iminobutanoate/2-iminopropanoate deaminase
MMKVIRTSKAPAAIGPYSQAVAHGGFLFVSGQIALVPESGQMISTDIAAETRQVVQNLVAILEEAGLGARDVVKCTIFVKDMDQFVAVNQVYALFFGDHRPARETVEVSALPKGANVEISAIAAYQQ